jgi:hypothetical protein
MIIDNLTLSKNPPLLKRGFGTFLFRQEFILLLKCHEVFIGGLWEQEMGGGISE